MLILVSAAFGSCLSPLFVPGGTGRSDQVEAILPLTHRHATGSEVSLDGAQGQLVQSVHLQQVMEGQNRSLIRDQAASIAGSLSRYHCCKGWTRNIVSDG
jgi:hypothetical protein